MQETNCKTSKKSNFQKSQKPIRDVLQQEAQGLVNTTGSTLGTMIATANRRR